MGFHEPSYYYSNNREVAGSTELHATGIDIYFILFDTKWECKYPADVWILLTFLNILLRIPVNCNNLTFLYNNYFLLTDFTVWTVVHYKEFWTVMSDI